MSILTAYPSDFQRLCKMYQEVAAEAGYSRGLGEKIGVVRAVHFGRTEEEAVALLRDTDQGMIYWDDEMRQRELFARHVIPAFR